MMMIAEDEKIVENYAPVGFSPDFKDPFTLQKYTVDNSSTINMDQIADLQPTINIGMIGHVAHGKSTLVKQITGITTGTHSKEQKRNMTIKLGYANAKIFKCEGCPRPACYKFFGSGQHGHPKCKACKQQMSMIRHVSFIDCPGHEVLMSKMLNASASMDAAIIVMAANAECPQPQTAEHLAAAETVGIKRIIPIQNKLDLVSVSRAKESAKEIRSFIEGTSAEKAPLIPISAQYGINVDVLGQYIAENIPQPEHDLTSPCRMQAIRSFDVNKPGSPFEEMKGGVLGGTLSRGILRLGQLIEIRPGLVRTDAKGDHHCYPLFSKVVSMSSEKNHLEEAIPGGLIGVGTTLDPSLAKDDGLVGQTLGPVGTLSPVYQDIQIDYRLLRRLVGMKDGEKVAPLKRNEQLLLHVGSNTTRGVVLSVSSTSPSSSSKASSTAKDQSTGKKKKSATKRLANIRLTQMPVCADPGDRVAFSRAVGKDGCWRLIGMGTLTEGSKPLTLNNTYAMKN